MKRRKINFIFLGIIISCFTFIGCKQEVILDDNNSILEENNGLEVEEENNNKENIDNEVDELTEKEVFSKYKDFLLNTSGKYQYTGYAEYGFDLSEPNINTEDYYIEYKGTMSDGYGEDERGSREFTIKYNTVVIGKYFKIIESINNNDYMAENKNTLNSIIPDYVVIYNNIGVGTHWTQEFKYNDKTYIAETKVVYSDDNIYKLETTVNNIDGFYNKIYKEERTYEKGYGLTYFANSPNYIEGEDPIDLLFGYSLNK